MIEVKNYCPELENAHYAFASKMFGERRKRRNPDYIYWKFRGQYGKELKSFKLAISGNEVVGQFGVIPCSLRLNDEIVSAQWACDLMVDKAYRGKGVAAMLYEAAHEENGLTLGSNASPAATKSMMRNGYKALKSSDRYFIPIFLGIPFKMKGYNFNYLNKLKNPFLALYDKEVISNHIEEVDIHTLEHHTIFKRNNEQRVSINIDDQFKDWRFRPFKDYYPGVKAYKLINREVYFTGYFNGKTYFITDSNAQKLEDYKLIIAFILKLNKPNKLEMIRFAVNDKNLRLTGLRAISLKYRTPNVIIYYTKDAKLQNRLNKKEFYYTYQDSDENI